MAAQLVIAALEQKGYQAIRLRCESVSMDGFGNVAGEFLNLTVGEGISPNKAIIRLADLPEGTTHLEIKVDR